MDYRFNIKLANMLYLMIGALLLCTTPSTADNLLSRIQRQVKAEMSSVWNGWDANKAFDGKDSPDPDHCNCCSGTKNTPVPSWWRIDLGNYYLIQGIIFTGRNDGAVYQSQKFKIYDTFQIQGDATQPIYVNNASGMVYNFTIDLSPPVLLRYMLITNHKELSICEIKLLESKGPCLAGLFGEHCDKNCHCTDRLTCNRTTGVCQSRGCLSGWKGVSCHLACASGRFGQDCGSPCRCLNNQTCNNTDGRCPGDKCAPGWKGSNCSVSDDLITRIRSQANASMSSVWQGWNASNAFDGIDNPYPNNCNCCSGTKNNPLPAWWRLDLGNYYLIKMIVFTGRNDDARAQSQNFKIYDKFGGLGDQTSLIYEASGSADQYYYVIPFSSPKLIRYLEITNTIELTICEIQLIESTSSCPVGLFGEHCGQECHCNDRRPCNRTTGLCQSPLCLPGWKGYACQFACEAGRFGQNCAFSCHCFDNHTCNNTDGSCPGDKCSPGYKETNCSVACSAGTFGQDCSFLCHCNVSQTCNHINGNCPNGDKCSVGWTDSNCSIDTNLIRRIRPSVRVSSSQPPWKEWTADKAIDFNELSDPNACNCCSGSTNDNVWWRISLGDTYPIETIVFIGRSDGESGQSRGFYIFDDFKNRTMNRHWIYKNNATEGYHFVITFHPPRILQYVEITSPGKLTICEIKFIESERCPPGYFGEHCTEHCHCNDSMSCERKNGHCQNPGCIPGWQGDSCNKKCDWGFYGDGCASQCHCFNNASCESASGNCSNARCAPGWQGLPTCSEECDFGSFGHECAGHCHCYENASCHNENGTCSNWMCAPGWKTHSCSQECDLGSFGLGCSNHCHCYRNASCNNVNGNCSNGACAAGWQGFSCSEKCTTGMFGHNCNSSCHCLYNNSCHHIEGYCSSGHCAPGWQERNCSIECGSGKFGDNCSAQCHCINDNECNHVNGICPSESCAPGWRYNNCSAVCDSGKFGDGCMSYCHCFGGSPCHHKDGSCTPDICAPGWWGHNCSIECTNNTFGQNCNSSCHCNDCHHITGSCETLACFSSWKGAYCNVSAEPLKQDDPGSSPAVIIGPIVAVVVLVAVVAAILFYRRHASHKKTNRTPDTFTDLHESRPAPSPNRPPHPVTESKIKKSTPAQEPAKAQADHTYYSYSTTANTIQIPDLWDYIKEAYEDNLTKMHLEFKKLSSGLLRDCIEASRPENARKNRYRGMVAYDHSRVVLQRDDPSDTTYINACYIDGFSRPKKFIAAQGPQESTVNDFWEMVVQQNASLIVMLTNVIEIGSRKCVQYWAFEEDEEMQFGDINITTVKISTFPDYIIRELSVSKAGRKPHHITQVHFTAWPDKDVPEAAWHLVNVWRKVNFLNGNKTEPIVVHCSAGVGRTGTFIALDILHAQAKAEGCIQPLHIVTNMRQQRVNMVQTKDQYVFLHEAVAESLYLGVKPIKTRDFEAVYTLMLENGTSAGEIGLEQQFLFLQQRKGVDEEGDYYNIALNESDEYRPKGASSVAASRPVLCQLQNHAVKETFIVSRAPPNGDDLPQQMLNVILNKNIKTIINLHIGKGKGDQAAGLKGGGESTDCSVKLLGTERHKHFLEKTFELKERTSHRQARELKQFAFLMWRDGTPVPSDTSTVIELLNAVQRWQPATEEAHPILVVCEFGNERSGLVCGLLSEFERIRLKEEVNLLETIKAMKERNHHMIPNYVQYKYCHTAVLEYIRQSDVYMNV